MHHNFRATLFSLFLGALFSFSLSGCGGTDSNGTETSSKPSTIKLVILNEQGDVKQGNLVVHDKNRVAIVETTLTGESPFLLTIPAETNYPVVITIEPDPNTYAFYNQPLKAVVVSPGVEKFRVSTKSTRAVEYAIKELGGVTKEAMVKAGIATFTPDRPARLR